MTPNARTRAENDHALPTELLALLMTAPRRLPELSPVRAALGRANRAQRGTAASLSCGRRVGGRSGCIQPPGESKRAGPLHYCVADHPRQWQPRLA